MRVESDRRHLRLPVIGTVRTQENTRRIERLIRAGRARVLAISVRRNGTRLDASVRVLVQRPQQPGVAHPDSRVGVDVGVRRLATVADADGTVIARVSNPRPLDAARTELRHVSRARSRCTKGSRHYRERTTEMSRRTGGSRRRKPAISVGMFRTSAGPNTGNVSRFGTSSP